MNKTLLSLLMLLSLVLATLPGISRASDGDYIPMQVPDIHQAVGFFHNVMNCVALGSDTASAPAATLMDCGHGNMVELSARTLPQRIARASHGRQPAMAMVFETDDAVSATQWLRANHVVIVDQISRTDRGTDTMTVSFLTPWGDRLQLVSHTTTDPLRATATRLASQ